MNNFFAIIISYALGTFLTGYYLVRHKTGQDVRTRGSGNAGARNVGRILGTTGFIMTFIGDSVKGILALLISIYLRAESWAVIASVLAVVMGHIWPVQLKFKGGKGVSSAFGAILVFDYRIALVFLFIATLIFAITRKLEISGFIGLGFLPLLTYLWGHSTLGIIGMICLACLLFWAHRSNILNLMQKRKQLY